MVFTNVDVNFCEMIDWMIAKRRMDCIHNFDVVLIMRDDWLDA